MSLNLSSLTPQEQIATLYIAYFDRAPAPSGLSYWVGELVSGNMTIAQIANSFAVQLETIGLYPELGAPGAATPATNAALVKDIFNNLFGRDPNGTAPDYADNYWVQQLNGGADIGFIVLQIANGAVGNDLALLENKIEVGLDWSAEALINDIATTNNPLSAVVDGQLVILDQAAYDNARSVLDGVTSDPATVDAAKAATDAFIAGYGVVTPPTPTDQVFVLTDGTDVLTGGAGDDEFLGNQDTTDTSDVLDGAGGDDTLTVSVQTGAGNVFTAPTLRNIETVEVNGPNLAPGQNITIDLSNASGYETLRSFQTTADSNGISLFTLNPALVAFRDIQNANGTKLELKDTDADHRYTYDTNAFVGGDTARIELQEVDGSTIDLVLENAPGDSLFENVHIESFDRTDDGPLPTTFNKLMELNVGQLFTDLTVTGDADLEIDLFLDENVENVWASNLGTPEDTADLDLALKGQGVRVPLPLAFPGETQFDIEGTLTVEGATGDNTIIVDGDTNGLFTFQDGDDLLVVGHSSDTSFDPTFFEDVFGNSSVNTAGGDDTVILNQTGVQNVDLGEDDDTLVITGNVDDLSTYLWNDGRENGVVSTVVAGGGNDSVTLNGLVPADVNNGLQNDPSDVADLGNDYDVFLGEGDDTLVVNGGGNLRAFGDDGEDDITVNGNGDQFIDSGDDDDTVAINGTGVHEVILGQGNDDLSIIGSRLPDNNIDNTIEDRQTTIKGNDGDDTIFVDGDHYLLVELGTGADSIELNADELTVDDSIFGNADGEEDTEIDTLILNNNNGNVQDGHVGRSETSSVSGIDVFDLRDTNITLLLSSDNFDTALNGDILVKTTEADKLTLPVLFDGTGPQLEQGMSRDAYESVAEYYFGGNGISTDEAVEFLNDHLFLITNGLQSINFFDGNANGDAQSVTGLGQNYGGGFGSADSVDFQGAVDGKMIVDITNIPMSVASGRNFTFEGGNIRDVIVADDASISSRLILDFDASRGTLHSVEDTLQVIDGAQITAADLRNVSGLEIIELLSADNDAQVWQIELNDRVINQTTSNAPLIIRVDPDVPAGSEVYIDLDPSIWSGTATKNVIIETVANAQIFIDSNDGNGPQLVTQPDWGVTDFNPGPLGSIIVLPRLVFTQNADNLEGTDLNDTFIFDSISKLSAADSANGFDGHDTLLADGVTVANQGVDLFTQLGKPGLTSIEEIEFDTGMNVLMTRLDGDSNKASKKADTDLQDMLDTLRTGSGNDRLLEMEAIGNNVDEGYFLGGGNDFFSTASGGSKNDFDDADYYADGGAGSDEAVAHEDQELTATDFELVILNQDADANLRTKIGVNGDAMTVQGSENSNSNYVDLDTPIVKASDGTLATVLAFDVREIDDNSGDSIIIADNNEGGPDGDLRVNLGSGDDSLTVTNVDDLEINAGAGTKNVTVGVGGGNPGQSSSVNSLVYNGGTGVNGGVDIIRADVDDNATINTGDLNDDITVFSTSDGPGATVTVNAGNGDDKVFAASFNGSASVIVNGGAGADSIEVDTVDNETSTIDGGLGIDDITLSVKSNGGADTVVIGNIVYNNLQQVAAGTTQNFVQNGVDDPAHAANTAENGIDTVTGFNMEGSGAGAEDRIDIRAFITDDDSGGNLADDFQYADWRGGITNVDAGDYDIGFDELSEIAVLAVNDGFELDASHIVQATFGLFGSTQAAPGVEVVDNGSRVVAAAYDTDGDGAFDTMDLYLVQDVDQDAGQAWAIDKIMTVEFATEIGAITSIDTDNFLLNQ